MAVFRDRLFLPHVSSVHFLCSIYSSVNFLCSIYSSVHFSYYYVADYISHIVAVE